MDSKVNNISAVIKSQIKKFAKKTKVDQVGKIITISDGIALVTGLENVMFYELVEFPNKIYGIAFSLEENVVGTILLGLSNKIKEGDLVYRTNKIISIPVGTQMLGRIVDALGIAQDGLAAIKQTNKTEIFKIAPGVVTRDAVREPLETGIIAIDAMVPIGKGQRELIIGDRQTGKTSIAIDTIINQKNKGVYCIYVAIGQKNSSVAQIVEKLKFYDALKYTTIVLASASELPALKYLAPYTGITIAEVWMQEGKDVLIVYDDLTKHAIAYRTLSLLLRRPPGREAYPGDIFYIHSQLLERAAKLNKEHGGGSITALPIIETQVGDIASYIPTNVISITDGQIFTLLDLFNAGQRPALDPRFSVSRVGSNAQIEAMKEVSKSLKLELSQYNEMIAFSQFVADVDESTQKILNHGKKVLQILKQKQYHPLTQTEQVIILFAIKEKFIDVVPEQKIQTFKTNLIKHFHTNPKAKKLYQTIETTKALTLEIVSQLKVIIQKFMTKFVNAIVLTKSQITKKS